MKKWMLSFLFFFLFINSVDAKQKVYVFHRYDCPHCREEISYLESMKDKYKDVEFIDYEVIKNPTNLKHLGNVKKTLKDENNYVPYTVIGKYSLVGFNENTKLSIQNYIEYCIQNNCPDIVGKVVKEGRVIPIEEIEEQGRSSTIEKQEEFMLPFFGKVKAKELSLPILSIVIGFLDGFNPCAMWVLLFLISMLLGMKDRKRMWILGVSFLFTSAMVYTLFLVSWLKINLALNDVLLLRFLIALVALLGGSISLIRYIRTRKDKVGCTVTHKGKRNRIMGKIRNFTKEKSIFLSLIGVITLAISVNFIELACSAGLPLVYTQILSLNQLSCISYTFNIFLYIFFYLIDDLIIFCTAMFTLKVVGITNKYNKYSHLIGGILLVIIGFLLLFKPEILFFAV